MDNLVNVLMPVHNKETYLERAVDSILNQTYKSWELIIIDDYSDDRSCEIASKYQNKYDNIKVIKLKNKCLNIAEVQNKGLELARGKYVAIMDADDYSEEIRFEKEVGILESDEQIGAVSCWLKKIDINNKITGTYKTSIHWEDIKRELPFYDVLANGASMIRLDVLNKINGFDESYKYSFDSKLWIDIVNKGYKLRNIPEYLYYYRLYPGNNCHNKRDEQEYWARKAYSNIFPDNNIENYNSNCIQWIRDIVKRINGRIYIWGSGAGCKNTLKMFKDIKSDIQIQGILDNKNETKTDNIYNPETIINNHDFDKILVSSHVYRYEIEDKLKRYGLIKEKDYFFTGYISEKWNELYGNFKK